MTKKLCHQLDISESEMKLIKQAETEYNSAASSLNLPEITHDEARRIYSWSIRQGFADKIAKIDLIAAAIYLSVLSYGTQLSLSEISEKFKIPLKEIIKAYKFLLENLRILNANAGYSILRFGLLLKIPIQIQRQAWSIIDKANELKISAGKSYDEIAATALYVALIINDKKIPIDDFEKITKISKSKLNESYHEFLNETKALRLYKKQNKRKSKTYINKIIKMLDKIKSEKTI